ncbi:50S ribosomal protein l13 [Rhodotorula toruloides]|uniref:50S ribosomal protein l13 n=1 Tax=Rhodotorula toruloides TaxID=5286 RepID=A0A511KFD6_RHOTO|nr:50S ribosomal protein l13 [Rhodotorula toruloides]
MPSITPNSVVGNTALAYARAWRGVDADGQILGRLATRIAIVLMGKHKPIYDPATDCGDYVVVTNCDKIRVTGKKAEQKVYRHHTMFPGGLKTITYKTMMEKNPEQIIRKAVSGMLPKNRLREPRLERLKIFTGTETPYDANIIRDHADEFGKTFKKARQVEQLAGEVAQAQARVSA